MKWLSYEHTKKQTEGVGLSEPVQYLDEQMYRAQYIHLMHNHK